MKKSEKKSVTKPEKVFRIGLVSASVFCNEIETANGKRDVRNVTLQRRYRDGDEWKNSSSLGLSDLPQALEILRLALTYVEAIEADVTQ